MKKFFVVLLLICSFISPVFVYSAGCEYDSANDVGTSLSNCLSDSDLVNSTDVDISSGGFGKKIKNWTNNLAIIFSVLAVGSIVYGSILLVVSTGEEEKIKKAKDVIKWGLIGFLGIISASTIISIVVNILYSIG